MTSGKSESSFWGDPVSLSLALFESDSKIKYHKNKH